MLYELFTGRSAITGDSMPRLREAHEAYAPNPPSSVNDSLSPEIDQLILDCLEKDPRRRPASALAVAARLPGGDILEAALAAGETPSPDMVADAGDVGGLSKTMIMVCAAAVFAGIVAATWLADQASLLGTIPFDKPPAVLLDRARQVCDRLGYTDDPGDEAYELREDRAYLRHLADCSDPAGRRERLAADRPTAVCFWYRSSPREMVPQHPSRAVDDDDPPFVLPGGIRLVLDTCGRLVSFAGRRRPL